MSPDDPLGIIELGNKNLTCLIFKIKDNNESEIISTSVTPSEGIYNDVIVNLVVKNSGPSRTTLIFFNNIFAFFSATLMQDLTAFEAFFKFIITPL